MVRVVLAGLATASVLLTSACAAGGSKQASPSPQSPQTAVATVAATAIATPAVTAAQAATPGTNPLSWVTGTVKSVSDGKVTLQDGSSFTLDPQRPVSRLTPATT